MQVRVAGAKPTFRLIQVLRGIAALMVVAHHTSILLFQRDRLPVRTWMQGSAGVDIFFVISGFVMTISSAPLRHAIAPARTFLSRRLERIVPMYWLVTTVKVIVILLAPALALNGLGGIHHVLTSYLFFPSVSAEGRLEPVVVVGWTLNYEMAFYLLFAGALALRWRPWVACAPVLAMLPLLFFAPLRWLLLLPLPSIFYIQTVLWEFLFGMLLGAGIGWARRLPWGWGAVLLTGGFALLLTQDLPGTSFWRGLLWGGPALAVVAGAVSLERRWGARSPRWALEMGDASYSIYLVHTLTLPFLGVLLLRWPHGWRREIALAFCVAMVMSALSGEVVYRLVERPIMAWFRGRRRTAIPVNT